jgi:heterodisulfide reductase subunit C2
MLIQITGAPEAKAFRQTVMAASDQNLLACLQCGKCTGGCPVAGAVAHGPRQMIAVILLGLKDEALTAELPWYCVGCAICASRCPVRIDFSRVAAVLVEMAVAEDRAPVVGDIHRWEEVFLASVRRNGRVREVRAILENNLRARRPWQDAFMGLAMFARGLFSPEDVLAGPAQGQPAVARIFENVRRLQMESEKLEVGSGK